ncbi:MAG: hypothetical protein FJX34_00100 [Alphaproteobacteria bacterium]|nr:hypothetical protein [Alphaproteobacteria bacterium]
MEDFGYQKTSNKTNAPGAAKRALLAVVTLFSFAIFIYITISAYHFVRDDKADIELIQSPDEPIKVSESEENNRGEMQVDHSVYEDIFGNKKEALKEVLKDKSTKIRQAPEPALPPKPAPQEAMPIIQKAVTKEQKKPAPEIEAEKRDNTAPAPAKTNKKRTIKVQVTALSSREAAEEYWLKLNRSHNTIFSGLRPFIEKVDLDKRGIFYRLQVGVFSGQIEAEKFCERYVAQARKSSADCIVVE